MSDALLQTPWPPVAGVHAVVTTRLGGHSQAPYGGFNLATHVNDQPAAVLANRRRLGQLANLPGAPVWLQQVHGVNVLDATLNALPEQAADAAYTRQAGIVLPILVADCLPVLLCSHDGREIAALHAGWRGLASGIIDRVLDRFASRQLHAFLGPAIGPCHYEVDTPVREAFGELGCAPGGFLPGRDSEHWMLDLRAVARHRLQSLGVEDIAGSDICTVCDTRFYSFRRDGETGRFAALIWRD